MRAPDEVHMSKTDKDRPIWVQNAEHGHIDHDHRTGECIVSNDQRDRWPAWRNHWRTCKKRVTETFFCAKKDPYMYGDSARFYRRYRMDAQECWTWRCRCDVPRYKRHACRYGALYTDGHLDACPTWGRVQCDGHTNTTYDRSIPCVCDDRPPEATCTPSWKVGRYYTYGGVPSAFVTAHYHRPERAREREDLDAMRREYNTYGDIEDGDFVNRQARNSVRWIYW